MRLNIMRRNQDPSHILDEAMDHHRQGRLIEAQTLYETIVADHPTHFTAQHMLGVIACQQARYQEGADIIKRALVFNPRSLSAHTNLINALEMMQHYKEAAIYAAQLVAFEPCNRDVMITMARLLEKLNLDELAIFFFDKAINLKEEAALFLAKGNLLLKQKNAEGALTNFKQAIALNNGLLDAYANAGTASAALNRIQEALAFYDQGLSIDPYHPGIKHNKNLALHTKVGEHAEILSAHHQSVLSVQEWIDQSEVLVALNEINKAIIHIENAIQQYPENKELYSRQGIVLLAAKKYEAALESFYKAIKIDPQYSEAIINAANTLMWLRKFENAIAMLQKVLTLDANNAIAINNIGSAMMELNQREEALLQFNRVLELMPEAEFAKLNAGFCYLALEDYSRGLPMYEFRWQGDLLKSKYYIPRPIWSGRESLDGKTIFLYGEQGFGDTFQFGRYIGLVAKYRTKILLGLNDSIKPLFKRSFPFIELTDKSIPLPPLDYYCPLGSLPLAFNTTVNTIPASVPYLVSDAQLVEYWRQKIQGNKPRIGLVWRGNPDNPVEIKRALPLSMLIPLMDVGATFFSLKIDVNKEEQTILNEYHVKCVSHDIRDFDDTAAIIENMDLIISTDTSVAHLAGALGKPVWIMLSFSTDWRWHTNRKDSPWYPSARLFRQPAIGDWESVITDIKTHLIKWLNSYTTKKVR